MGTLGAKYKTFTSLFSYCNENKTTFVFLLNFILKPYERIQIKKSNSMDPKKSDKLTVEFKVTSRVTVFIIDNKKIYRTNKGPKEKDSSYCNDI